MPNTFIIVPKWQSFVKSRHSDPDLMILERLNLEDECRDAERKSSGQGKSGCGHRDVPAQLPVLRINRNSVNLQILFNKNWLTLHCKSAATWGQFHKTLWICKLQICSYDQILTVNLLIKSKNFVIYGKMAVNYEEKSFMEAPAVR